MPNATLNPTTLSDQALLQNTMELVKEESRTLTKILQHLAEIDRRRLYSSLQCSSLFQYTVKLLGYSEDEAYRRINAMKLVRQLPELEEKVQSGAITLSNLNLAQTFFRQEKVVPTAMTELLSRLENKSSREAQKIVAAERTSPPPPLEKIRFVGPSSVEIHVAQGNGRQARRSNLPRSRPTNLARRSGTAPALDFRPAASHLGSSCLPANDGNDGLRISKNGSTPTPSGS